ncbi:hypothetical protein CY34DRAFT_63439, partial [Suillus luteus UH-Slu-Lm8-n1]
LKGHGERIRSISYCPDGQRMISGSSDKTARQWDVETGTMRILEGHSRRINCVDISVDNMLLASGADDVTARIWNLDTGKLVAGPFKMWAQAHQGLAPSFDGTLLASFGEDRTIKLWAWEPRQLPAPDAATTKSILKPVTTLKGHGELIQSISYFPDGQRMISGSVDQTARQWDVKAGNEIEK